ncbi:unnamed protein product [Didymodactylos carnosus]|uniref:C2H2-type domain-containing protein n=1 Tax=Didymodactylos carnosus TaxID=1234261 RepID=A0A8S2F2B9_9BILA|nr:unnamed protein product [Didymodactylos carnosus]CAF4109103.1 unnamed protein product [Didymodactylos carnosus]
MVDTGSGITIIRHDTLKKFSHHHKVKNDHRTYSTANNGELKTIGTVWLKVKIGPALTFVKAAVSNELCTSLLLGSDWAQENNINIKCGERIVVCKTKQGQKASVPFFEIDDNKIARLVHTVRLAPRQEAQIQIRVPVRDADTLMFTPNTYAANKSEVLFSHALIKVENYTSLITVINPSVFPRVLSKNITCISTVSYPSSRLCVALVNSDEKLQQSSLLHSNTDTRHQCRECSLQFPSRQQMFNHLRELDHWKKDQESDYEAPKSVCDDIDKLVTSIDNRVEREKVRMLLRRYAEIFDTTKPSVIDTTIKHTIDLEEGSRPTTAAYYRQNPKNNEIIDEAVKQLLQEDRAERSYSAWSSPIVLVKKKMAHPAFVLIFAN